MRKRLSYSILVILSLILVSSFVVYAAFVMTHNYEADINYHEITIDNSVLTTQTISDDLVFNEPGDKVEIAYTLSNNDSRNYQYYYTITTSATDDKTLSMIYVYQNGIYCGLLNECIENGLLAPRYILAGENTTSGKAIVPQKNSLLPYIGKKKG